jgi:glyoxylase I family protein
MRRFARKSGAAQEVQMHKPVEFSHAAFRIADVDKRRAFYENVLGLKSLQRPDFSFKGMWYGVGSGQIHLIVSKKQEGPDPTGPHIAIEVEDLDATKASLKKMGVPFLDGDAMRASLKPEDQRRLGRQIWVLDPDGNTVELRKSDM